MTMRELIFNKNKATASVKILIVALLALFAVSPVLTQTAEKRRLLEAEQALSDLGYWILDVDGKPDESTRHALIAFQKMEGRKRTGILNDAEMLAIRRAKPPAPRFEGDKHVEVDLTRQVVYLVSEAGEVSNILPISSGSEKPYFEDGKKQIAHTPRGTFKIERQIHGTRKAPLGNLYNPSYFYKGVAIHGSNSIPVFPASHGCVRIPRFADKYFIDLVHIGMTVYVFD